MPINWVIVPRSRQSGTFDVRMSWGTGLDELPGQDGPAFASNAQSQQLLEELFLLFLAMPGFDDDSSSASSYQIGRSPCAGVYSAACGTQRRKNPP